MGVPGRAHPGRHQRVESDAIRRIPIRSFYNPAFARRDGGTRSNTPHRFITPSQQLFQKRFQEFLLLRTITQDLVRATRTHGQRRRFCCVDDALLGAHQSGRFG